MNNYQDLLQKQNLELKSALSFLDPRNSEKKLEEDFIKLAQEENLNGERPEQKKEDVNLDPTLLNDQEESPRDEIEGILASDDEKPADVVEWDNFSISKSDDYSNKLQQEQGLNVDDANAKSFYIKYKTPDELLAVQGKIFGFNRDEGQGIKGVGGYGTKEEIGKDLEFMKNLWETGFPVKEKDNVLVTLDELSPALQSFQKQKEQDKLKNPKKQEPANVDEIENKSEIEKTENSSAKSDDELAEELKKSITTPNDNTITNNKPKIKSPSVPTVKPIGKVPAYLNNIKLKRESRLTIIKNIDKGVA